MNKPVLPLIGELPLDVAGKVAAAIEANLSAVEALMSILDASEGNPDDEPEPLEPSLEPGSANVYISCDPGVIGGCDDLEADNCDLEPSLGSLTSHENWTAGGTDDREGDEHDGREPSEDEEPSLAHGNDLNQERATVGVTGFKCGGYVHPSWDFEAEHDGREPDEDLEPDDGDRMY